MQAHRYSFEFYHKRKLKPTTRKLDGELVLHTCDNPSCVNPKHLKVGTQLDNIKDRDTKGRQSTGPNHYLNKSGLNVKQVRHMRKLYNKGIKIVDIAKIYEENYFRIRDIVTRRSWAKW